MSQPQEVASDRRLEETLTVIRNERYAAEQSDPYCMALEASRRGLDTFNEKGTQSHRTEVHSIASGLWHDFTTITDYHKTGAFDPPLAEDVHSLLEQVHEAVGGRHNLIYEEGIHWPRAKMISDLFATIALDGLRARSSSLH